jgi:hypothetical protein
MADKNEIRIETRWDSAGVIRQRIIDDCEGADIRSRLFEHVMDTREAQTRKALIDLGWTPPA